MNRRIPDGAWCLFRANPAGTREGKVVVVQLHDMTDPETGGQYTIKRYTSEKVAAEVGDWRHRRIVLHPDSTQPEFQAIVIDADTAEQRYKVVAELLFVLPESTD
jgi:hypothetical protein